VHKVRSRLQVYGLPGLGGSTRGRIMES